ncbi:MAG: c-type cytochrome [Nitrospinota bacterium]|nr:c-type cytochrome [Nitrospinota bacterium]
MSLQAAEVVSEENLLLAMHQGRPHGGRHERHQMHHGMGRGGQGICPQTRTTTPAPDKIAQQKNPLESNSANFVKGESLYQWTAEPSPCKVCHGPTGNGLGMMTQGLSPMPRNFTCTDTMKEVSDGQMFWIIKNGSPGTGMPAYKFLSDDEIWKLIIYIRNFEQKKNGSQ